MNEIIKHQENLSNVKALYESLMKTPHYAKMGNEGVFAIVSKAIQVGIDPLEALNGGMYYVKGKVELSAQMMNAIIREQKHSITKDPKSDDNICILHGKRSDTGDVWTESYSLKDAAKAGVSGSMTWKNHPRSMMFARALSLLARQLFPDVIRGCYVEGEIDVKANFNEDSYIEVAFEKEDPKREELFTLLCKVDDTEYLNNLSHFVNVSDLKEVDDKDLDRVISSIKKKLGVPVE